MPNIDLSILNQRQTPAFYADVFANRPAAGYVGRIFVSTDTFAFYRDNGTGWDLIGGPGTGTVTGTGANGQVTFWNGASTITGSNDLFWDSANGHLGIGTNLPGTALQIDHDQSQLIRLNQTTATNDTKIAFQNSGTALWRIGNSYNAGANDFGIFDAVGNIQPITVKKTTGQVLIGTSTVGSGKLVVASATGDNGVQIVGATAPSLRIDNAESGPTKRAGLGISTATNNFIQGSADRDFCMFNGSTTASPILFGIYGTTNVQEAARISAARNFLIGTVTDSGERFIVSGTARISGDTGIGGTNSSVARLYVRTENNANNPALTIFKNEFTTATEDVLRVQSFENGVGVRNIFTIKTNGAAYIDGTLSVNGTASFPQTTTFGVGSPTAFNGVDGTLIIPKIRLYNTNPSTNYSEFVSAATQNRSITFPDASGTVALTSDLSSYLPLSGGTLTGNLNGTTSTFSGTITATNGIFTSGTGSVLSLRQGGNDRIVADGNGYVYMPFLTSGSGIDDLGWWASSGGTWGFNGMLMRISSSIRYKKNIRDIEIDTSKIFDLKIISFENNENTATNDLTSFGLLAEDVAIKLPILATYNEKGEPEGVQYKMLSVLLLNELKKIKSIIENLK